MWKRWLALLLAGMLVLCMTGCRRTGGGEPSDQKINVYTSKDYETKDFVAQLGNVDYVGLVEEILANTEPVDSVPDRTPDYIVQILPPKGIEGAITWWFWTDSSGELTLVNASEDKEKAYRATANTSHDFGKMLEEVTLGQGAKCCCQLGKQENPEIRWNLRVFMLWRSGQHAPSRTAPQNLSGRGEDKDCPGLPPCRSNIPPQSLAFSWMGILPRRLAQRYWRYTR